MRKKTYDRLSVLLPTPDRRRVPNDVWEKLEPSERVMELTGHSLDNCRDILDLPLEMAIQSPNVMQGKVQMVRAILTVVAKIGLESNRLRQMQEEVLGQLIEDFDSESETRGNGRARPHRDDFSL